MARPYEVDVQPLTRRGSGPVVRRPFLEPCPTEYTSPGLSQQRDATPGDVPTVTGVTESGRPGPLLHVVHRTCPAVECRTRCPEFGGRRLQQPREATQRARSRRPSGHRASQTPHDHNSEL